MCVCVPRVMGGLWFFQIYESSFGVWWANGNWVHLREGHIGGCALLCTIVHMHASDYVAHRGGHMKLTAPLLVNLCAVRAP